MNLRLLILLLFFQNLFANQIIDIKFDVAKTNIEKNIKHNLQENRVIKDLVNILNEEFTLNKSLTIIFGGNDGPLYNPMKNEILIPYSFVEEVRNRFEADNYEETGISIDQAVSDSLAHTLFHELGHAFITMFNLPIVGKEEDAVDSLATILLIELFENGADMAISAADLFSLESEDIKEFNETDFWDEHSLDIQRFYSTSCLVYGSNPKELLNIKEELELSEHRAELCIDEYENTKNSWFTLLEPYLKEK